MIYKFGGDGGSWTRVRQHYTREYYMLRYRQLF